MEKIRHRLWLVKQIVVSTWMWDFGGAIEAYDFLILDFKYKGKRVG